MSETWRAVFQGLIGAAQVLIWWSLLLATSGIAVAVWLLVWPALERVL